MANAACPVVLMMGGEMQITRILKSALIVRVKLLLC